VSMTLAWEQMLSDDSVDSEAFLGALRHSTLVTGGSRRWGGGHALGWGEAFGRGAGLGARESRCSHQAPAVGEGLSGWHDSGDGPSPNTAHHHRQETTNRGRATEGLEHGQQGHTVWHTDRDDPLPSVGSVGVGRGAEGDGGSLSGNSSWDTRSVASDTTAGINPQVSCTNSPAANKVFSLLRN
jgi:hypothetical protein